MTRARKGLSWESRSARTCPSHVGRRPRTDRCTPEAAEVTVGSCCRMGISPDRIGMSNPWAKKNPFMSMWLTAANRATGSARGQATGAARRQAAATQAEATRQILEFWVGKPKKPARKRPSR